MADYLSEIQQVDDNHDQQAKILQYKGLIDRFSATGNVEGAKALVERIFAEDVSLVVSRAVLMHLAVVTAADGGFQSEEKQRDVIEFSIQRTPSGIISYDEPDALLREKLAQIHIDEQEYVQAARVLANINLETSTKAYTDEEKAQKFVTIGELYLQEDDTVNAEIFINRAARIIHEVKDWALQLRFKVSYARILDSKLKFLDAAIRYYDLSQADSQNIVQEDLLQLLSKAVTCAILASAGPQRSRVLGTLYKDERTKTLEHAAVLEKMFTEKLLRKEEIQNFSLSLMPHQKAVLGNGFTVLEQAALEHNMLAASKVYTIIHFDQLGTLLEIDAGKAEKVAARMISEERMKAKIDQIEGLLLFEDESEMLQGWDQQINDLCLELNSAVENITKVQG